MIDVAVAPKQPLIARHRTEGGMTGEARVGSHEAPELVHHGLPIAFELDGLGAAALLIDFPGRLTGPVQAPRG